ncbi:MAG: hypothetical protein ACJ8F7_02620 [Gemmataceae bacterium]
MAWKWIAGITLTVAVAASTVFMLRGSRTEAKERPAAKPVAAAPAHKVTKEETAVELAALIRETKSPEAFMMALTALVSLNPKDRSVMPLAIRKADELGMLKGMFASEGQTRSQEEFCELFEIMLGDSLEKVGKRRSCREGQAVYGIPPAVCPAPNGPVPAAFVPAMPERLPPPVQQQPMPSASY